MMKIVLAERDLGFEALRRHHLCGIISTDMLLVPHRLEFHM